MNLSDIEQQIQALQQQAEELRRPYHRPAAWRRRCIAGEWHLCREPSDLDAAMVKWGWEPLWTKRVKLDETKAKTLAAEHRGIQLVRAVERAHGIGGSDD